MTQNKQYSNKRTLKMVQTQRLTASQLQNIAHMAEDECEEFLQGNSDDHGNSKPLHED